MYSESAILLVGDELLSGRTRDANLQKFSDILRERGLPVVQARVLRDVPEEIATAVRELFCPGRILVITGGMGPTDDDLTVASVAAALKVELHRSKEAERMVRERQMIYGLGLPDSAMKQADIPLGAVPVMNTAGIAPGIVFTRNRCGLICMPGVPAESEALLEPCLREAGVHGKAVEPVLFLRTWGLKENALYDRLQPLALKHRVVPGYLPSPGRVDVKVKGSGAEGFRRDVLNLLKGRVYSTERDRTLEQVLAENLLEQGLFLATAESCTGGGIGQKLTSVTGSSRWYAGGVVSYSNRMKTEVLGVSPSTLDKHGAVSGETAAEMARGAVKLTAAQCAVAVTGIAGPGGGSPGKPVGTVWTAALSPRGERADCWRLGGNREAVREGAASRALGSLLELLT